MFLEHIEAFIKARQVESPNTINAMIDFTLATWDETRHELSFQFPVSTWQLNPMHTMHGGMIATAFDITMGCLSYACNGGNPNPTIEMQVRYLKPVKEQDVLMIQAKALRVGRGMVQLEAHAYVEETCVAQASGSYKVLNKR